MKSAKNAQQANQVAPQLGWSMICMILSLLVLSIPRGRVLAQSGITFGDAEIENQFPDGITFKITASSIESDISKAKLTYKLRNDISQTQVILEFAPASEVDLSYTWDTRNITVPPSAPIFYHWEVVDSAGNRARTEDELYYYDDVRYDWTVLQNDDLSIWYHDRPESFGKVVFDIANLAFQEQRQLFGESLSFPIRIIIYNNDEEFTAWHSYVSEFVGGQAFSALGITTQIVTSAPPNSGWLNSVIPHEISHLYFYQVTEHPLSIAPSWLNEGLAQYNEFGENQSSIELAKRAISEGDYIPLTALTGSFGYDAEKVHLAYAESVSAVTYLVEAYGNANMAALFAAYRDGLPDQQAFKAAMGISLNDFEQDWLAWMGAPEGTYGTPTPTATLAWVKSIPAMDLTPVDTTGSPPSTPTSTMIPMSVTSDPSDEKETDRKQNPTKAASERKPLLCLGGLLPGLVSIVAIIPLTKMSRKSVE
jgi:hypothetical protein